MRSLFRFFTEKPYDFDSFRRSIVQMRRAERADFTKLPIIGKFALSYRSPYSEAERNRMLRIIEAMTPEERQRPHLIDIPQNRRRVAVDAGVDQAEVLRMIDLFDAMADHVKQLTQMGFAGRLRWMLIMMRDELAALRGKPAR